MPAPLPVLVWQPTPAVSIVPAARIIITFFISFLVGILYPTCRECGDIQIFQEETGWTCSRRWKTHNELMNLTRDRDQKKSLAETEPARLKELSVQLGKKHREVQAEGPEWKFGK